MVMSSEVRQLLLSGSQAGQGSSSTFEDCTVASVDPLRIKRDGDSTPLSFEPDSLIDASTLQVGDRVHVELQNRRLIILGVAGGPLVAASSIVGELDVSNIPDLPASKIPDLPASKITSGTLSPERRWEGAPYRQAAGKVATPASSSTIITNVYFASVTVTFPASRFTVAPVVTVGGHGGAGEVSAVGHVPLSVSASGFTARVINFGGPITTSGEVHWSAVQMTETTAEG